jgi:hypothetical protein
MKNVETWVAVGCLTLFVVVLSPAVALLAKGWWRLWSDILMGKL